jgi:transcriptional regulator with XRE-family HTH domain
MDGTELRAIRKKLGLSQHQFAKELGIHWNTLARAERGEHGISGSVEKLARLLLRLHTLEQRQEKPKRKNRPKEG